VAGPNGSGKSTFAASYLLRTKEDIFLNPDIIASGLGQINSEKASFHAARLLIREVKERISKGENFGFESTLSGKTWFNTLKKAHLDGYEIIVSFLFLSSVNQNLKRIKQRVKEGGHFIPNQDVLRRYPRCFKNFWNLYRPLCSRWYIFDNSGTRPKLIMSSLAFNTSLPITQKKFETEFLKRSNS